MEKHKCLIRKEVLLLGTNVKLEKYFAAYIEEL